MTTFEYVITLAKLSNVELDRAIAAARDLRCNDLHQLEKEKERRKAKTSVEPLNI